jgi:hypothetical protein
VQFFVGFVKTDNRTTWIVWLVVEIEDFLHPADEDGTVLRCNHP